MYNISKFNALDNKSGRRGSNSRPSAWEADALPTELLPRNNGTKVHIFFVKKIYLR